MPGPVRYSLRELLLLVVVVALAAALIHHYWAEEQPVYLHVFGTNVDKYHDLARPKDAPLSSDDRPWMRVATLTVYSGQSFGVFMPNDRSPAIGLQGKLQRMKAGQYRGQVIFWLDDNNLTYDHEIQNAQLEQLVYIDQYSYCYLLSKSKEPYAVLTKAMQPASK